MSQSQKSNWNRDMKWKRPVIQVLPDTLNSHKWGHERHQPRFEYSECRQVRDFGCTADPMRSQELGRGQGFDRDSTGIRRRWPEMTWDGRLGMTWHQNGVTSLTWIDIQSVTGDIKCNEVMSSNLWLSNTWQCDLILCRPGFQSVQRLKSGVQISFWRIQIDPLQRLFWFLSATCTNGAYGCIWRHSVPQQLPPGMAQSDRRSQLPPLDHWETHRHAKGWRLRGNLRSEKLSHFEPQTVFNILILMLQALNSLNSWGTKLAKVCLFTCGVQFVFFVQRAFSKSYTDLWMTCGWLWATEGISLGRGHHWSLHCGALPLA